MYYLVKNISINGGKSYDIEVPSVVIAIGNVDQFLRTNVTHNQEVTYDYVELPLDTEVSVYDCKWDKNINCDLADYDYCGKTTWLHVTPLYATSMIVTQGMLNNIGLTELPIETTMADHVLHILKVDFLYTIIRDEVQSYTTVQIQCAVELLEGQLLVDREYMDDCDIDERQSIINALKYIEL
jgi:hypothetical protein